MGYTVDQETGFRQRQGRRLPFLRPAKVSSLDTTLDAVVTDVSAAGIRITCERYMPLAEEVTIELKSGEKWRALRRWQSGLRAGFVFATPGTDTADGT